MLTVAGLISRIKTIFFFSFQEGQVLIGLELETAPFAFHASHPVFMWEVVYQLCKQRQRAGGDSPGLGAQRRRDEVTVLAWGHSRAPAALHPSHIW